MKRKKGGYGIVYQDVMRNPSLPPESKAIYAYLSSMAGGKDECYPSRELMAKELDMSISRLDKYMAILVSSGVVEKKKTRDGNLKSRNIYKVTHEFEVKKELEQIFENIENQGFRYTENRYTENRGIENRYTENQHTNNNSINNNSLNNNSRGIDRVNTTPSGIKILLNDKSYYEVSTEKIVQWRDTYPAVDIEQELKKMVSWCDANPARRKTRNGVERFINSWLSREQDRGGTYRGYQPPTQPKEDSLSYSDLYPDYHFSADCTKIIYENGRVVDVETGEELVPKGGSNGS